MSDLGRVGLTDVAEAAGVSKSTASRALRGESRVSKETTEHVLGVAARLGYVRDLRAAQLASTGPTTVGLLLRGAERSFYGAIAARVQEVTDSRGIELLIVNGGDDDGSQRRAAENLLGHRVAGVMIASGRASASAAEYVSRFVPTVLVGLPTELDGIDSVAIDAASEREIAQRVVEAGHRSVAIATNSRSLTLRTRAERFSQTLRDGGAEIAVLDEAEGALETSVLDAIRDGATAIMSGDDPTAVRVLEILAAQGVGCPDGVSVTGFDGIGVYRSPLIGLATMRQPVESMASGATDLMSRRLDGSQTTTVHAFYRGEYLPGRTLGGPAAP